MVFVHNIEYIILYFCVLEDFQEAKQPGKKRPKLDTIDVLQIGRL